MLKKKFDWKELGIDLLVDLAAGMLGAVGIYNFALNANCLLYTSDAADEVLMV